MSTEPLTPRRFHWIGYAALIAAVVFAALEVVAIVVGSLRHWAVATLLGDALIGLTVVSFVVALAAVIFARGRRAGIAALVVSAVANPLVQIAVLGFIGRS
jgi:hypothetical protein